MPAPTKSDGTQPTIPAKPIQIGVMSRVNSVLDSTIGFKNNIRHVGIVDNIKNNNLFYNETDYVWKVKRDGLNVNRETIRMMEIIEYQPNKFYDWVDGARKYLNRFTSAAWTGGGLLFNIPNAVTLGVGTVTSIFTKKRYGLTGAAVTNLLNGMSGYYYRNYALSGGIEGILNLPMVEVVNYFSSNPVCRYIIPFNNPNYISVDGSFGWGTKEENKRKKSNLITSMGGNFVSGFMDKLSSMTPSTAMKMVNWNPEAFQTPPEISTDFYLYNDNLEDLIKNLKFILMLSSGTFWTTIGSYHFSSNFYRIRCPNMFDYYYCGMSIEVSELGTKRLLHPDSIQIFKDIFGAGFVKEKFTHFPDGYNIKISFKPLVPNNFNIYINNLIKNNYEKQGWSKWLM